MADYIDRKAVLERYHNDFFKQHICDGAEDVNWLRKCIDEAPTADVAPVRHGKWIEELDTEYMKCSACGEEYFDEYDMLRDGLVKYCPNCGALMDGGKA